MPKTTDAFEHAGLRLVRVRGGDEWSAARYDPLKRQMVYRKLGTTDEKIARTRLIDLADTGGIGEAGAPETVRLAVVLDHYFKEHASEIPSAEAARIAIDRITAFFGDVTVAELRRAKQEAFVARLRREGLSEGYISRVLSVLRAALRRAEAHEQLSRAPRVIEVQTARDKLDVAPRGRPLSPAEMAALWDAIQDEHILLFMIAGLSTLARPGAILELDARQIDHENGLVHLNPAGRRQTKKHRPTLRLTPTLARWTEGAEGRLVTLRGRPVASVKTAFRGLVKRAGLDSAVSASSLRHTMARELRAAHVPADQISIQLGHLPVNVKRTDLHYSPFDAGYLTDVVPAIEDYLADLEARTRTPVLTPPWAGV